MATASIGLFFVGLLWHSLMQGFTSKTSILNGMPERYQWSKIFTIWSWHVLQNLVSVLDRCGCRFSHIREILHLLPVYWPRLELSPQSVQPFDNGLLLSHRTTFHRSIEDTRSTLRKIPWRRTTALLLSRVGLRLKLRRVCQAGPLVLSLQVLVFISKAGNAYVHLTQKTFEKTLVVMNQMKTWIIVLVVPMINFDNDWDIWLIQYTPKAYLDSHLLMQPLDMMNQSKCSHRTRIKYL